MFSNIPYKPQDREFLLLLSSFLTDGIRKDQLNKKVENER